jgi:hypothetical protein
MDQVRQDVIETEIRWAAARLREIAERLDALVETGAKEFPLYSQKDPLWADDRLGPDMGGGTLGGAGCAVTCAAMLCTAVGCEVTPGELNAWLCDNDGFSRLRAGEPRNQLIWGKVTEFCLLLRWDGYRYYRYNPADVTQIKLLMELYGPVVAEVDFDYTDRDVDQHFVVLLDWLAEDEVEIADPWDGQRVRLTERYFNPAWSAPKGKVARVITGLRTLQAAVL